MTRRAHRDDKLGVEAVGAERVDEGRDGGRKDPLGAQRCRLQRREIDPPRLVLRIRLPLAGDQRVAEVGRDGGAAAVLRDLLDPQLRAPDEGKLMIDRGQRLGRIRKTTCSGVPGS